MIGSINFAMYGLHGCPLYPIPVHFLHECPLAFFKFFSIFFDYVSGSALTQVLDAGHFVGSWWPQIRTGSGWIFHKDFIKLPCEIDWIN